MLIRKLRLERGWSQETLAEISGLSVRTIQRLERGGKASLESLSALAATFGISISDLSMEAEMYKQNELSAPEQQALEYVRDIKGFYHHVIWYVAVNIALAVWNLIDSPDNLWFLWCALGWGAGLVAHGLAVFEVVNLFGPQWERREVEKRLERQNRE